MKGGELLIQHSWNAHPNGSFNSGIILGEGVVRSKRELHEVNEASFLQSIDAYHIHSRGKIAATQEDIWGSFT
jgi:hypothetical protein